MNDLMRSVAICSVFISAMTCFVGCGGNVNSSVSGKVTLDGQPIETGAITFIPIDKSKGQTAGASIEKGEYRVQGEVLPPPGNYRVEITAKVKTGKKIPAGSPLPAGTMIDETVEGVPAKYNKNSTLKQELKAGTNTADFALESK